MTDLVEQVIARLDPVFAPSGFRCQRSHADADGVLFHCDGADVANVATRYPAWFADVARSCGDDEVTCLDLWVQQEDGRRFADFGDVTDEELANAAGREAVARMHSLAAGRSTPGSIRLRLFLAASSTASRRANEDQGIALC